MAGTVIGLPPVLNFGSAAIKEKVVPEVLSGQKPICLAISEAFAGSDVAGLKTYAKKTPDGKHWVINGTKKWITNGTYVSFLSEEMIYYRLTYISIDLLTSMPEVVQFASDVTDHFLASFTVGCRTDVRFPTLNSVPYM